MCMHDGIHLGARVVNRRMNHRLARRILEFGDGSLIARLSIILFADFHILVNIHRDNMFGSDFAERREHRLDKKIFAFRECAH